MSIKCMAFPCSSAGVFCYMVHDKQTFFILGRERFNPLWVGSGKWAEFGGQAKLEDGDSISTTAARECFEESIGVFGHLQTALHHAQYNFQVLTKRSGRHTHGGKATYVLEVPWDPNVVERFQERREQLQTIAHAVDTLQHACDALASAQTVLPVPGGLYTFEGQHYHILDLVAVEQCVDNTFWLTVVARPARRIKFCFDPLAPPFDPDKKSDIIIVDLLELTPATVPAAAEPMTTPAQVSLDDPAADVTLQLSISADQAQLYSTLVTLRNQLADMIVSFPQDVAARAIDTRTWIPTVNKDFLEKDQIRLWSMAELQECIYGQDKQKNLRFSFLVALKIILQQLSMCENGAWREGL